MLTTIIAIQWATSIWSNMNIHIVIFFFAYVFYSIHYKLYAYVLIRRSIEFLGVCIRFKQTIGDLIELIFRINCPSKTEKISNQFKSFNHQRTSRREYCTTSLLSCQLVQLTPAPEKHYKCMKLDQCRRILSPSRPFCCWPLTCALRTRFAHSSTTSTITETT